jgi:hypothetical protein
MKTAAIYARVSSDRQKNDQTIASQTAALKEYASSLGFGVPPDWIFEDDGFSGSTLVRPSLERLRDIAAQVHIEVLLCYSPDRLARKPLRNGNEAHGGVTSPGQGRRSLLRPDHGAGRQGGEGPGHHAACRGQAGSRRAPEGSEGVARERPAGGLRGESIFPTRWRGSIPTLLRSGDGSLCFRPRTCPPTLDRASADATISTTGRSRGSSGRRCARPGSPSLRRATRCATVLPPICSSGDTTSGRCRSFWVTRA